ncbi:MAG: outer membrane protein transport protein [Deltaproteobacteria bacterium]|nr:outer membrane protein transport protein [Deltaproteobacteria bacterium]
MKRGDLIREKRKSRFIYFMMVLSFVAIFTLSSTNAWAFIDFVRIIGYNADSLGRGGTSIAVGDGPSDMNVNPAVISKVQGNSLETNLFILVPTLDYEYDGTGGQTHTSHDKDTLLVAPGMSFNGKIDNSPWSWGLSLAAPDAIASDYTIQSKYFGPVNGYAKYLHLRLSPGIAYQVSQNLSVGARLGIDNETFDLRMPLGLAYLDIGQCNGFGFSGAVGILYKPIEKLSIGLYYESPSYMQDLESRDDDGYIGLMTPGGRVNFSNLDVDVKDLNSPQNFGVGIAWTPSPAWRFSADVKYFDWDKDWDEIEVKFSGSGAAALKAAGLPTTLKVPLNIDDQVTFGVGAEYFFGEIYKLSLGYHYNNNAMNDNSYIPYAPAAVDHTMTCGFSVRPAKNVKLSIAYMYSIFADMDASDYHGFDKSLEKQLGLPQGALDSELNGSSVEYDAHALQLSVVVSW